ncbi:MAG: rRNA maturation RNase YbeY [Phycisphaerae bacterium]
MATPIRRAARHTLTGEGFTSGRLEIALVKDAEMRHHHRRWLSRDTSTDVLSFDLRDEAAPATVDGQIIVCESVARREARARRTDWCGELLLYVVHGCLHLCGYDDRSGPDYERMHRREATVMAELGWASVSVGRSPTSRSPEAAQPRGTDRERRR